MNLLILMGIAILSGLLGGKYTHHLHFPSVVGYLIVGLILGPSILNLFSLKLLDHLGIFNDLALSIIAFIIGVEMHMKTLRKMGKSIVVIILFESFCSFFLVSLGVYLLTGQISTALIFGAMAPASAPAGTVAVLQEYKAKGPLTSTLYAVVGLDDGLAIIIYAFAIAIAKFSLTQSTVSYEKVLAGPLIEIAGSIVLGGLLGTCSGYFIQKMRNKNEILSAFLAAILLSTGFSNYFHFSFILANLALGMALTNLFPFAGRRLTHLLGSLILPLYITFFVLAGAHFQIKLLPVMGSLGMLYILYRTIGKMSGAFLGALVSHTSLVIRKYLGLGILSQAGVAIGLAISVTRELTALNGVGKDLAHLVITTITATTIVFETIGPIGTKTAISKAGEIRKIA